MINEEVINPSYEELIAFSVKATADLAARDAKIVEVRRIALCMRDSGFGNRAVQRWATSILECTRAWKDK